MVSGRKRRRSKKGEETEEKEEGIVHESEDERGRRNQEKKERRLKILRTQFDDGGDRPTVHKMRPMVAGKFTARDHHQ